MVDHVAPGTTVRRRVEVTNSSPSRQAIRLYVGSAQITDGAFGPLDEETDLTTWSSVSPGRVELPAGGEAEATVTIDVPRDASSDERYGVVWAEVTGTGSSPVTLVNRVGVRIYLSVGPGGEPESDFAIETLTARRDTEGRPVVAASVRNTGGRALDMAGTLTLADGPGGLSAGPFPAELGSTLAPRAVEPVTVVLDERLPAGPWKATITLRSGVLERTAEATITFPSESGATAAPVEAKPPSRAFPVAVAFLTLAVAVALLLFLLLLLRSRRRANREKMAT